MDLQTGLLLLGAVVGAAVAILKVVAPKTKTTKDDKALEVLEKADDFLPGVDRQPKTKTDVKAVQRDLSRDHRK